jgi:hypothetical protein
VFTGGTTMDQHRVIGLVDLLQPVQGLEALHLLAPGLDPPQADLWIEVEKDREVRRACRSTATGRPRRSGSSGL